MAVVINEFEAIAEEPAAPRGQAEERPEGEQGYPRAKSEEHDFASALQVLAQRALRSWAH